MSQSPPTTKKPETSPPNPKTRKPRESLSRLPESALVSPTKPHLQNSETDSQTRKNLHDDLAKFDFTFKKKASLDATDLSASLVQDLSAKLGIAEDSLDGDRLKPIWPLRNPRKEAQMTQNSFRVSQSVLVLRLLLRGKLREEISLMTALNKIWGNQIRKKDLLRVLKSTDFNVIVDPNQRDPNETQRENSQLRTLKIAFVNVSAGDSR